MNNDISIFNIFVLKHYQFKWYIITTGDVIRMWQKHLLNVLTTFKCISLYKW